MLAFAGAGVQGLGRKLKLSPFRLSAYRHHTGGPHYRGQSNLRPRSSPVFKSLTSHRIVWSAVLALAAFPAAAQAGGSGHHGGGFYQAGQGIGAQSHLLDMYKVEQFVGLAAGDTADQLQVSCNNGDYAIDGMWRADQVNFNWQIDDPGPYGEWNKYNGIDVSESQSVAKDTWEFTITNNTSEDAQAHVWITCLGRKTAPDTSQHDLILSKLYTDDRHVAVGDAQEVYAGDHECASDEVVVAPGFVSDSGVIKLYRSWPDGNGLQRWTLGFYGVTDPNVTTSARCLKLTTDYQGSGYKKHRHKLRVRFRQSNPKLTQNQVNDVTLSCGQTEKGLLGAFDIRYGHDDWTADYDSHQLWYIGMEPQLKSRVFHIWNHSEDTDYKALLGLVCFDDRTGGPIH